MTSEARAEAVQGDAKLLGNSAHASLIHMLFDRWLSDYRSSVLEEAAQATDHEQAEPFNGSQEYVLGYMAGAANSGAAIRALKGTRP